MAKRAPFVAVDTDMRKNTGLEVMSEIMGCSWHEALGRLVELWMHCADRKLLDAPSDCPGYAVSENVVKRYLGEHGVVAITGGGVDEFAMGYTRPDGLVALRKTERSVKVLRTLAIGSSSGGLKRASSQRDVGGRYTQDVCIDTFVQRNPTRTPADIEPNHHPTTTGSPPDHPPAASVDPLSYIDPVDQEVLSKSVPASDEAQDDVTDSAAVSKTEKVALQVDELPVCWTVADTLHKVITTKSPRCTASRLSWKGRGKHRTTWAHHIYLLINKDKKSVAEIGDMIRWLRDRVVDQYSPVVESADSLREKWDGLEKEQHRKTTNGQAKVKDIRHGRVEPQPPEAYPGGEQKF